MVTTEARRAVVTYVERSAKLSERRACRYVSVHRALCRYVVTRASDEALRERIKTLATERPRWIAPSGCAQARLAPAS